MGFAEASTMLLDTSGFRTVNWTHFAVCFMSVYVCMLCTYLWLLHVAQSGLELTAAKDDLELLIFPPLPLKC